MKDIYYNPLTKQPPQIVDLPADGCCSIVVLNNKSGEVKHSPTGIWLRDENGSKMRICKTCLRGMQKAQNDQIFDIW